LGNPTCAVSYWELKVGVALNLPGLRERKEDRLTGNWLPRSTYIIELENPFKVRSKRRCFSVSKKYFLLLNF